MKDSPLLEGNKSLSDAQIKECLGKFIVLGDVMSKKLPQTEYESVDDVYKYTHLEKRIKFVPKSSSNGIPSIELTEQESCSGFEKMKTIIITVNNCGLCRGTKTQKFNNTNIAKFEKTLILAKDLYQEAYAKVLAYDKEQVAFDGLIEEVRKTLNEHKVEEPDKDNPKHTRTNTFLHHHRGEFTYSREYKNFEITLKRLSKDQAMKLGHFL